MKKALLGCVLCIGIVSPLRADDTLVRFDGGIGVIPVSNITLNADGSVNTVSKNVVRGVNPPGQIWVIARLRAEVDEDGRIEVDGRGLLLGGGNNVGLNGNQKVFATLICSATAPFDQFSTPVANAVALAANGDFRIDDTLTPTPPSPCASPVLLIRNTGGAWFAAGILKLD